MNQGQIQSNNNSGNGYTTTNWAADEQQLRHGRQRRPLHVAGHLARALQEDAGHLERRGRARSFFFQNERPLTVPFDIPGEIGVQPHVWKMAPDFDGYPALAVSRQRQPLHAARLPVLEPARERLLLQRDQPDHDPREAGREALQPVHRQILGSTPPGTTPTGTTVGGAFNLVNQDGVRPRRPVHHRAVGRDVGLAVLRRGRPCEHGADQGLPHRDSSRARPTPRARRTTLVRPVTRYRGRSLRVAHPYYLTR